MSYSLIDKQTIELLNKAADFFALGRPFGIEPVTTGLANRNFIVKTKRGEYVIKDALIHPPQEILQEIAYLEHLRSYSYPAPVYLRGTNGEWIFCPEGHTVLVQEKVIGEHPKAEPGVCRIVGKALARLHQLPSAGLPKTNNWMDRGYMRGMLEQLRETPQEYTERSFLSYEKFRDLDLGHLPQSIVHNDLYPDNLLFEGFSLKAVLDWEEVGVDAAVMDIGQGVYGLCLHQGQVIEPNFLALLEGYTSVRPLQEGEADYLCSAVQYIALTNSVWLQVQFGLLTPDEEKLGWAASYWRYNLDELKLPVW